MAFYSEHIVPWRLQAQFPPPPPCIVTLYGKYTRALNFENLHDMCDMHTPGPVVDHVCGGGECDVCGGGECIRDC